ncbi:hypothetical protein K2Z83_25580 [Oscillochloris sp. ZM17-4]|uniref:hypothetical protein n=1 Tax=Oscillochloris sp. ZM17-4 TaxID=2866714 RepID=UPI001C73BD5F|nr:hypothetical protein [Oscillochloris sp. ZM17-4]MBX0331028.1 hypothetical protein [Oscillochloris sp. ZM17-4]
MIRLLLHLNTNDLWLAYGSAQLLLQGANPYDYPTNGWPSNPLPTVLVLAPFSSLSLEWVGVGMITVSTTLLIFGILRANEPWRLYTLLSLPFWYNLIFAQWGILFLAMLLLPELIWLSPVKPQLGLSVFLSRFRWRQALYAAAFLALSWLIYPGWPMLWLAQVGGYDGFIPILYLPIPILAIIIIRKLGVTSREVLFFLLFCCTPQRLWHDQLLLWAIPDRPRSALLLTIISWASIPATEMLSNLGMTIYWGTVLSIFVPSGLLLLAQGWHVPKTITKQALV